MPICVDADHVGENPLYQNIASSENVASIIFFVSPSSNVELFIIEPNPSIKYKKKIDVWIT